MPQPTFGTAAATGIPAFSFGGGARAPLPSAADAPLPSYSFAGGGEDAAPVEPSGERAGARARRALARLAPTRRALLAAAAVGLLAAVAALGVLALPALPALPSAGGMVGALRELPQRGVHALLRLAASCAASAAHGAWWLLRLLPQLVTRGLSWVWALPRNEKVGGLVTLAALFFLHRAFVWYERCRHSLTHARTQPPTHPPTHPPTRSLTRSLTHPLTRSPTPRSPTHSLTHPLAHPPTRSLTHSLTYRYECYRHAADADHAKLVDEAVRWAVSELKEQHERWSAIAGAGSPSAMRQAQRLHASELQRRMPESYRAARFVDVERGLARLGCRDAGGGSWEWVPAPGAASPLNQGRAPTSSRRS